MVTISRFKIFVGVIFTTALLIGTSLAAKAQDVPNLEQGMEYSEARQILLDTGWQALDLPWNYRENPLSDVAESLVQDYGYGELVDCSETGLGFCRFEFSNANERKLVIITVNNDSLPELYRWWLEEVL